MSSSYPEIAISDRHHLIEDDPSARPPPFHARHRWCLALSIIFAAVVAGHAVAIYFIYFRCHSFTNCATVRIMALNTWGMPESLGSQFKAERMNAIADELRKGHYDLYLFSELWMEHDHYTVAAALPEGYHMTGFRQLALSTCDGRVAPTACSGLAVASKYPFVQVTFDSYTYHGDVTKVTIDGEWLARKGVGRLRISPLDNVTVDVFVTHTAADPDPWHNYTNEYYRVRQVQELMETFVKRSTADVILLGGDFNAGPDLTKGEPYMLIREFMTNCIEEFFYKLNRWLDPEYATYGNKQNTFSSNYQPIIYDYIFHKTNANNINVWTNWFEVPFLKTMLSKDKSISFSDHEAVTSTVHIWK